MMMINNDMVYRHAATERAYLYALKELQGTCAYVGTCKESTVLRYSGGHVSIPKWLVRTERTIRCC